MFYCFSGTIQATLSLLKRHLYGQYDLTDKERAEVLALSQEEGKAACICQNKVLYPQDAPRTSCGDRCQESINSVIGYIDTVKTAEEKIWSIYKFEKETSINENYKEN